MKYTHSETHMSLLIVVISVIGNKIITDVRCPITNIKTLAVRASPDDIYENVYVFRKTKE